MLNITFADPKQEALNTLFALMAHDGTELAILHSNRNLHEQCLDALMANGIDINSLVGVDDAQDKLEMELWKKAGLERRNRVDQDHAKVEAFRNLVIVEGPPPKSPITEKEACFLTGVIFSDYNDSGTMADWPVWTWSACDFYQNVFDSAGTGGIVASLKEKGLLGVCNVDTNPDDHTVWITKQGLVAWKTCGHGRTILDWFDAEFTATPGYQQKIESAFKEADAATTTN